MKKMLFLVVGLLFSTTVQSQVSEIPEMLREIGVSQEVYASAVSSNWLKICKLKYNKNNFTDINVAQPGDKIALPGGEFYTLLYNEHPWRAAEYYTIKCFMAANQQPKTKMNYRYWLPLLITTFFLLIFWSINKKAKRKKRAHTLQEVLIKNNMPL